MDATTAQAMWEEANINIRSQRTILRYLRGTFGKKLVILSIKTTSEVADNNIGGYKNVNPCYESTEYKGETIDYWTKPLTESVCASLSSRLFRKEILVEGDYGTHKIDFMLGDDHGQSKFRMLMKVITRREDMSIIDHWVLKVAHIDYEKDTYQVLRQTITPFLNTELTKLIDGTEKVHLFFKENSDGVKWFTSQLGKNESIPKFVSPSTNLFCPEFVYHKTCEVRVLLTGDLAFYAIVLGKVNMSGRWCTWCKLSPAQWGVENHDKGEL